MGMYAQGEIAHLCRLALPRLGIVTNVGPTHLERLGSLEAIAATKAELVEALPVDGVAILNGDDERVLAMSGRSAARVFTYGLTPGLDLWASDIISKGLNGISCTFHYRAESVGIDTPLLGKHSVYAALAAAAAGLALNLTWDEIGSGLRSIPNRLRLVVRQAANGAQIIDDSYNASPSSMLAALDLLEEMNGRHVAVLGDMLELGSFEQEGHRLVGRRVAQVAALLIAVGRRAQIIGEEALRMGMDKGRVFFAGDNAQAVQIARRLVQAGDVVLVKGSRGMKMEEIVTELQPAAEQQ
jgi:UDP-N-acetylmuramoyl-tripeptide--D-alanyl-D-alanine ligase